MPLSILQSLILGVVQGITEWLPISSSAALILIMSNFFGVVGVDNLIRISLFFHLGTFFAVLVYFRHDVAELLKAIPRYKYSDERNKKTLKFLFFATVIGGAVGIVILKTLTSFESELEFTGKTISFAIGFLLLFTGVIQLKARRQGLKLERELKIKDGLFLGVAQGLAVLPGVSRSGITISTLLLKKFDDTTALRLSFLMSLPIVLAGNIILNLGKFSLTYATIVGLLASFVFGLLTIHVLMKLSKKINFGWFVIIFSLLMMASILV